MTSPEQAIAARLTAIAERQAGTRTTDAGDARNDIAFLLAHVKTLTQQVADADAVGYHRGVVFANEERGELRQENARLTAAYNKHDDDLVKAEREKEQAEQARDTAHAALKQIVDESDSACGCDHTDENCCVLQGGGCAFCTAAVALDAALATSAPQKGTND